MCYTPPCKASFTFFREVAAIKNRISEYRRSLGLTQEELADRAGVTRQTIISLESGRYNASLLLAHRLAACFHVTIEELFIFEEES